MDKIKRSIICLFNFYFRIILERKLRKVATKIVGKTYDDELFEECRILILNELQKFEKDNAKLYRLLEKLYG